MDKPSGMVRGVLLALVLAIGAAIAWGVACGFVGSLIDAWLRAVRQPQSSYEQLLVLQDGTPVIATNSYAGGYSRSTFRTLNGDFRAEGNQLRSASLLALAQLDRMGQRWDWRFRVQGCSDFATPPSLWYFVHDGRREGQAWFEGFDSVTKQRVGWIGRDGFRSDPPGPDAIFAVDGRTLATLLAGRTNPGGPLWGNAGVTSTASAGTGRAQLPPWMVYLVSAGQLLEIDLRQRSVRTVLEDADLISVGIVERALGADEAGTHAEAPVEYLAARGHDCV
ncbi:MAG: hypothetical protein KJ000_25195 [Pirellulaceae bacterium]|nr:hypothetical protein [Pirellulaceae bacterium]